MFDAHERARFLLDEAHVAGISPRDTLWQRSHMAECEQCARHEETIEGIVRGLQSFAFECDPAVNARIQSAVVAHARRPSRQTSRWALAAAVVLLAVLVPVYRSAREERREKDDALLMERVEIRVQRTVPVAMEPLALSQSEAAQ
jgi:hypothetical protein